MDDTIISMVEFRNVETKRIMMGGLCRWAVDMSMCAGMFPIPGPNGMIKAVTLRLVRVEVVSRGVIVIEWVLDERFRYI
jgi:hypothetical protein